jgi:hypothetical protein
MYALTSLVGVEEKCWPNFFRSKLFVYLKVNKIYIVTVFLLIKPFSRKEQANNSGNAMFAFWSSTSW